MRKVQQVCAHEFISRYLTGVVSQANVYVDYEGICNQPMTIDARIAQCGSAADELPTMYLQEGK